VHPTSPLIEGILDDLNRRLASIDPAEWSASESERQQTDR